MKQKFDSIFEAVVAAAFVATIFGVCMVAGDYLALIGIERLLERWALVPVGWGNAHAEAIGAAAMIVAAPPTALIAWWIYRSSRESAREREQSDRRQGENGC